jgi:hypothetical protein
MGELPMGDNKFTSEEQLMVLLSFCAYCDFMIVDPHTIYRDIEKALKIIAPDQQLVWGPSIHKPEMGIFSDALMYVAQNSREPDVYTLVIRGTNPIFIERIPCAFLQVIVFFYLFLILVFYYPEA